MNLILIPLGIWMFYLAIGAASHVCSVNSYSVKGWFLFVVCLSISVICFICVLNPGLI